MCIDVQCYEYIEKLLHSLPQDHRFQVIFPTNDFFHVVKQYASSVFLKYHKLFFVPVCDAIFPPNHRDVFESPSLSQVMHICNIINIAYNSHSGVCSEKLRSLAMKRYLDIYVSALIALLEEHNIPRIVFGFQNVENEMANVDVSNDTKNISFMFLTN